MSYSPIKTKAQVRGQNLKKQYEQQDARLGLKKGTSAARADQMRQEAENTRIANQRQAQLLATTKANRDVDLAQGRKRGEEIFGNDALGRINAEKSTEIADILNRRKAQLEGYTPEEQQAMREQNMKSIIQGQQAGARDLQRQQARSGVRGALASNQQQSLQAGNQAQLADQERQLFLSQIAEKRGALDKFEGSQRATEQDILGRQQFNLDQRAREKLGALTTEMGMGSLGAAERASVMQQVLGESANRSAQDIAQQTKGKK
jgi:hypothetical protein